MRHVHRIVFAVIAVCMLAAPTGLCAQDKAVTLQQEAQKKFKELHDQMQKLQLDKAKSEPEQSKVLQSGNRYIQEKKIHDQMDAARQLIETGEYDAALGQMQGVREDLTKLLDLLLNRDLELQKMMEEIARLEDLKKRVEEIIEDQTAEKDDAATTEELEKHLQDLEEAKRKVDALIQAQTELRSEANQAGLAAEPDKARQMTEKEGDLKAGAETLAEKLDKIEKKAADLKAGKPGSGKPGEPKPNESDAAKDGKPGACSGSCKGAAGSMGKAQEKLGENKPERSLEDMDQAIQQLQKAKAVLEEMTEEARRQLLRLPFEQQVRAQEVTRIDTDRVAKDMEEADKADKEAQKQTPGKQNVQQAVPKQKAAAGQLKDYKAGKAKQDQQDALDELEEAKKKLEDALAQLRQELQDEVLRSLEERFGAMLAAQKELSASTIAADRLQRNSLTAEAQVPAEVATRCKDISNGEFGLGGEAGDALKLLEEEGSTAAFPVIVEELRDDLNRVAERVGGNHCGKVTQGMQRDIVATLTDLLEALRRQIELNEGGQCGSCNGQPPLVPNSAELKLVLLQQKRVNKRTADYDQQVPAQVRVTDEAKDEAVEISRKQSKVEDLTRRIATKMNKENQAGN